MGVHWHAVAIQGLGTPHLTGWLHGTSDDQAGARLGLIELIEGSGGTFSSDPLPGGPTVSEYLTALKEGNAPNHAMFDGLALVLLNCSDTNLAGCTQRVAREAQTANEAYQIVSAGSDALIGMMHALLPPHDCPVKGHQHAPCAPPMGMYL